MVADQVFLNGKLVPKDDARVSIDSVAFKYGAMVFEGLRGYWNEARQELFVFRLNEHSRRLRNSIQVMRMETDLRRRRLFEGRSGGSKSELDKGGCPHPADGLCRGVPGKCSQLGPGSSLGLVDTDVLRGSSLIVNGRSVAQGRVQALIVVVPEIASELDAEFSLGQEPGAMNEVGLERMKERFPCERCRLGRRRGSCSDEHPGRRGDPERRRWHTHCRGRYERSSQEGCGAAGSRHRRPHGSGRYRALRQAPSQDTAGVLIHHDRQVTPLPGHREIRDIADPNLIHSGDSRSPEVIRMLREKAMQARIGPVQPSRARPQSAFSHEAFYAPSTQAMPLSLQGPMNPRAAISPSALLEESTNLFQPDPVLCPACTLAALLPRVIPSSCNAIERTQPFHWERSSLALDEGEDVPLSCGTEPDGFF